MNKSIKAVIILTGLLFACTCWVLNDMYPVLFRSESQSHIFVRNPIVDLGVIRYPEKPRRISFKIENIGNALLNIDKIHGGCPCLALNIDRSSLPPGQKARLSATVHVVPKQGKWHNTILVCSNDPKNPITRLEVTAHIEIACMVLPSPVLVNNLDYGEIREVEFEIIGPTNDDSFRVLGVSVTTDAIKIAEVKELTMIDHVRRKKWCVKMFVKSCGEISWQENLVISTSDPNTSGLGVLVKVSEIPFLRIVPSTVCLKYSIENPRQTTTVEIASNREGVPLKISEIKNPKWLKINNNTNSKHGHVQLLLSILPEFLPNQNAIVGEITAIVGQNEASVDIPVLVFTK